MSGVRVSTLFAFLTLFAAAAAADEPAREARETTLRGKITRLRADEGRLTVRTRAGEEMTFDVRPDTRLSLRGREARLSDFREGQRVRVTYESAGGAHRLVSVAAPAVSLDDVRREAREALESARNYGYERRVEYQKKLEPVLHDLDERIAELKERAAAAGADAKRRMEPQIEELSAKRDAVREKLSRVRDAAPGAWDDVKAGVGKAVDDFQKAFDRLRTSWSSPPATGREPPPK